MFEPCKCVRILPVYSSGVGGGVARVAMAAPLFGRSRPHPPMAVIHLSEMDNKIYSQEGMCVN